MHYVTTNEICANKPHRLRRSEAMGGRGGKQTQFYSNHSSTM